MVDAALRHDVGLPAFQCRSPAVVYLLLVGEETAVKTAQLPPYAASRHQAGAGNPEYLAGRVILTPVRLGAREHAPPAEGEAVAVKIASGRTGILEMGTPGPPLATGQQSVEFRTAYRGFRMGVHELHQCSEPTFSCLQIGIQQYGVLRSAVLEQYVQSPVVPLCKTVVPVQGNGPDLWKLIAHQLQGAVAASIVRNDDLGIKPPRP